MAINESRFTGIKTDFSRIRHNSAFDFHGSREINYFFHDSRQLKNRRSRKTPFPTLINRGERLLQIHPAKWGDFSREAINQGTAIISRKYSYQWRRRSAWTRLSVSKGIKTLKFASNAQKNDNHRRTGRGGAGGAAAPQNFGQLRFFGQKEKFGQNQFLKKFPRLFFFEEIDIFSILT